MRTSFIVVASLIAGLTGFPPSRASDVVERQLDLRNATDTSGRYYVVFCARKSKEDKEGVGHAFVVWAEENEARKMSSARAFGFYPVEGGGKKAFFGDVPGVLANEATRPAGENLDLITHRLIVSVNRDHWKESQKEIQAWETSDYNLFNNNCTHFVHAVASSLGLIINRPNSVLPSHYLSRLIVDAKKHR